MASTSRSCSSSSGSSHGGASAPSRSASGRSGDDDDEQRLLCYRVLCPAARAGTIIGQGGDSVQMLRKATGARIKVEDAQPGCDDRVVYIAAPDSAELSWSAAQEALFRVHSLIVEGDNDGGGAEGPSGVRLLVPCAQRGVLLGRGGATLASLRASSGCIIRLAAYTATFALLGISGAPAAVRAALEEASHLLRAAPRPQPRAPRVWPSQGAQLAATCALLRPRTPTQPPRRSSSRVHLAAAAAESVPEAALCIITLLCPAAHAGALLGRGGEALAALRASTGARVTASDARASDARAVAISGAPAAAQAALVRVYAALSAGGAPPPPARLLLSPAAAAALRAPDGAAWLAALAADTGCAAHLAAPPPQLACAHGAAVLELSSEGARRAPLATLAALVTAAAYLHACAGALGAPLLPPAPPDAAGEQQQRCEVRLPVAAAGVVLGRGGAAIRALREASGARVKLHATAASPGGDTRLLCVEGSATEVDAAVAILARMLASTAPALAGALAQSCTAGKMVS